jgi:uncharacterized protein (TIGR03086 family)
LERTVELIDALDQTFQHAHKVIARVQPGEYDQPTPCEEWRVRDLLEHMVGVVAGMGASASGQERTEFVLSDDPAAQFEQAAAATLEAWRRPGALEQVIDGGAGPMPGQVLANINLLDTATHTWDLAIATDQPAALPDSVAEAAMEASRQIVTPELRPGRFAPECTPAEGADATDRLVSFLGRQA